TVIAASQLFTPYINVVGPRSVLIPGDIHLYLIKIAGFWPRFSRANTIKPLAWLRPFGSTFFEPELSDAALVSNRRLA
ncbi:MAG: hypothetical protein AAFW95_02635, partial [Cyanobacteria bacterium J06638_6]